MCSSDLISLVETHHCPKCNTYFTVFAQKEQTVKIHSAEYRTKQNQSKRKFYVQKKVNAKFYVAPSEIDVPKTTFPPCQESISSDLQLRIIRDFCKELEPSSFEEAGCAVCGQLTLRRDLVPLGSVGNMLHILEAPLVLV